MMRCPSGLNATLDTAFPGGVSTTDWPLTAPAAHTRRVPSSLPETMRCPSGLNARLRTQLVEPVGGAPIS